MLWILLLATDASAQTPMSQQQWIKFIETPVPQYNVNETENSQPKIISAEYIDVQKPLTKMADMVQNTMTEFARRYQEYAEDI